MGVPPLEGTHTPIKKEGDTSIEKDGGTPCDGVLSENITFRYPSEAGGKYAYLWP